MSTQAQRETLRQAFNFDKSTGGMNLVTPWGFGEPSNATRELQTFGLIEIEGRDSNWRAEITKKGIEEASIK